MEILGIGPMELFFIVILAIIILGPKDMAKAGKTVGKFLRDVVQSDYYKAFTASSREIRNLPTRLMREANLEDEVRELDKTLRSATGDPATYSIRPPAVPADQVASPPPPTLAEPVAGDASTPSAETETNPDSEPKA